MIILLPTLNRVSLLKRFLESYHATNSTCEVIVLVDDEDYEKNAKGYDEVRWRIEKTGNARSMGDKCRFIWDEVKDAPTIGLLNDDHVLMTPEWDKKADALLDGTNMLSTNDGHWKFGTNVVGLTAWSMPVLKAAGFPIFPKGMNHWFIDDVWKAIGEKTGCWKETMTINCEHRHVFNGKMEVDETARVSQAEMSARESKEAFDLFMKDECEGVCERIKALREEQSIKAKFL
jgi:hypothetical protein